METADETSINRLGEHDYRTFRTGSKLKISSLEVCPIHVDHSIPGAYGFIIYTSAGTLVYTGDMRANGPKAEMTEEFIESAAAAKPTAMITEGTRVTTEERR